MAFGDAFIFFPSKHPEGDWEARKASRHPVEEVDFAAADGVKLHAWFANPPGAKTAILYCHGNGGNITDRVGMLNLLQSLPAAVFLFDYRGYGKSDGVPGEAGLYADGIAALDWLAARGFPAERVILYGESLGGAVAVELATKRPVAGMVIQCAFSSIADMARLVVPIFPTGWFIKSKFASISKVGAIRCPKLHFHGQADEVIPFEQGRALFEAAAEPKRWIEYPELRHNDWPGGRRDEWMAEMKRFVGDCVK